MVKEPQSLVPLPPLSLSNPNILSLQTNEVLHRIHDRTLRGNSFNPCKGGPTRFAPLFDASRKCVPSLYAAKSVEAAAFETLFHDIPPTANRKSVLRESIELRNHSTLMVRRPLRLARLHAPDLMKWEILRDQLLGSLPTQYDRTVKWAEAIHAQFSDVEGLIWTSNKYDEESALLLFGDRVSEMDIQVVAVRKGSDFSFVHDVREAGRRAAILISIE
ncbi:MAG: RES family NAD+ phosphorylase [Gammaproteobacteria bacterium]|nr:RES family NAD+ phosphorylase [Gammaproteobacteria bacterium]